MKKAKKPVPTKELPKKRTDAEKGVEDDGSLFDIVRSNKTALSVSIFSSSTFLLLLPELLSGCPAILVFPLFPHIFKCHKFQSAANVSFNSYFFLLLSYFYPSFF